MDNLNQNYSLNEKLKSFTEMALREAYRKRKEILETTKNEIKSTLNNKEIELLEEAYRSMQTGTLQNRRELNEAVSKALVDGKRKMFDKRRAIIEDVFKQVKENLEAYKITTAYPVKIMNDIFKCFSIINDSEYEIEANEDEEDLFKKLITESKIPIILKISEENLGGGFIMNGITKRIRIDFSFKTAEQEAREKFLEMCRIPIDDGDLLDGQ